MKLKALLVALAIGMGGNVCVPGTALAETTSPGGVLGQATDAQGVRLHASKSDVSYLGQGRDFDGNPFAVPMVFQVRIACPTNIAANPDPAACQRAAASCQTSTGIIGIGFLYEIYARPQGSTEPWRYLGSTCFADQVPGATPTVSLAQIINAFHLTPWATATVSTQPEGNTTLVGLPTYARITWSTSGYEPGEIDTLDPATMLGLTVQIRPRVDHYTYVFGDGTTFGPTHSDGGVWPTGDVTHAYPTPGAYQARVDTTFTGDFRINGGPWTQIPDTVTVTGPTTTITVHTAKPVLVH